MQKCSKRSHGLGGDKVRNRREDPQRVEWTVVMNNKKVEVAAMVSKNI